MRHIFLLYHPAVLFVYLLAAVGCAMLTLHPAFLCVSFLCASAYSLYLNGAKTYLSGLRYALVMLLVIALFNPLFNHKGLTVLFKIGHNPVTLEALVFGLCSGGVLLCVIVWFQCYQKLMTNDRFLYLFGRVAPTAAMLVSMTLKWIPATLRKVQAVRYANAGMAEAGTSRRDKLRQTARTASIVMSWSMEDSIDTADSMRARGYGGGKRSHYAPYAFGRHDAVSLCILLALLAFNVYSIITQGNRIMFYPYIMRGGISPWVLLPYAAMLLYPLILEGRERVRWRP